MPVGYSSCTRRTSSSSELTMWVKVLMCSVAAHAIIPAFVDGRVFLPGSGQGDGAPRLLPPAFPGRLEQETHSKDPQRHTLVATHARHNGDMVIMCTMCPQPQDIYPCTCSCVNSTAAELSCGPDLLSCAQLTQILTNVTFPTTNYFRLHVDGTPLRCNIEEDMWGPLKFQEIILMNNEFKTIDNRAFIPFNNTLKLLNMGQNSLANVYFATLSDQPYLEEVLLQNNDIEFIPGYSIMVLNFLRRLVVSSNLIYQIQPFTFAGLPSLEVLDLSYNSISRLTQDALTIPHHKASALTVDLSHNDISSIEPGQMAGVKVAFLNLRNNQLLTLPETTFRPLIDVSHGASRFWVTGNPFKCDVHFCWIATNETVTNSFDDFRCPNLNNTPIDVIVSQCSSQTLNTSAPAGGAGAVEDGKDARGAAVSTPLQRRHSHLTRPKPYPKVLPQGIMVQRKTPVANRTSRTNP